MLPGPPTIYQTLLDHPKRRDYDLGSLRFAVTGAAIVPVVLIERMQAELDIDIVLTAYGLTEANGMGTMCRPDDDAVTVATTCGRPIADFELRIDAQEPGRRRHRGGRSAAARPQRDARLPRRPRGHRGGDRRRRLAAHRRRRRGRRCRQPAHHRPAEGHVHLRRVQRLPRRSRAGPDAPRRRRRRRGDRSSRRAPG